MLAAVYRALREMHFFRELTLGIALKINPDNNKALVSRELFERFLYRYFPYCRLRDRLGIVCELRTDSHKSVERILSARYDFYGFLFGVDPDSLAFPLNLGVVVVPIGTHDVGVDFLETSTGLPLILIICFLDIACPSCVN